MSAVSDRSPDDLLPDEVEGVLGEPHVLAAAGDGVASSRPSSNVDRSGVQHGADVAVALEDPHGAGGRRDSWYRVTLGTPGSHSVTTHATPMNASATAAVVEIKRVMVRFPCI